MAWQRLIRFVDESGIVGFGDACVNNGDDLLDSVRERTLYAIRLAGQDPFTLVATDDKVKVVRLLGVLDEQHVEVFKCIGLNYMKHIRETGRKAPAYPSMFMKPSSAVAAWDANVEVPTVAQGKQIDYEGELAVVIGKTGKNISREDALEHVAGFVCSNDVSARTWQRDPDFAGGVPQWSFAKSFDTFAPLGPMLVSPSVVGSGNKLHLQTFVNGEKRQDSSTEDLLFDVQSIISFLSQGSTLRKGTVIMTGTPGGVVLGLPEPKPWLQDGDIVEVRIEQLGSCVNRIVHEPARAVL
ncbi:uncharacterized protein AB675_9 [Cyphellophora attinorum]|uniref:Fumarylacetoacetase-like C-terminal domain-containing protein n=1 Tax=Cyphellophora attinorum TaxID=1664694 RepID=A0A0N0NHW5_9EURO|nr:uncharacterized protein AB675_9 [Phialophora attinorum]KPI34749.1 hypothetical protein AB675_9 [Phialophora attinorum]